jgi:hypothetical protein
MQKITRCGLLTLALAIALAGTALAQAPPGFGRSNRPTTSPYLNLLPNRNQSPALNYYRSYLPETEFRRANQQASSSIYNLRQDVDRTRLMIQTENSVLGTTGHTTSFGNTGSYFPGLNR